MRLVLWDVDSTLIRARAVAVATGRFSGQELAEHRPDALLDSLADTDAVVKAILGR